MTAREPDETPVELRHVQVFLEWYATRVKLPRYTGIEDHWHNALKTLTLGELRRGMKAAREHQPPAYLEPPRFWSVCKGQRSFATALETQRLRRSMRKDL